MFTREEEEARLQAGFRTLTWMSGALLGSLVYFGGQDARGEAERGRARIRGRRGGERSRCCRADSFPPWSAQNNKPDPKAKETRRFEDILAPSCKGHLV